MSTLGAMKSRIGRETRRPELTTAIAEAIDTAIKHYQKEIFTYNETRGNTFQTVASQEFYTVADASWIPLIVKIDFVRIEVGTVSYDLCRLYEEEMESHSNGGTNVGFPGEYSYYNETIRLYPIPPDAWTVRVAGKFMLGAPAADDTAGNRWMLDAEQLIRSHAKYEMFENVVKDAEMADRFSPDNESGPTFRAYKQLKGLASRRTTGRVRAWGF